MRKPYWLDNGTMLAGRYHIEDVVEEGGFGIVYMGWDEVLCIKVAVKEYFPRELAGREREAREIFVYKGKCEEFFENGLERFLSEARMIASLNSQEGIVWVQDFFYENNTAYIIMEYVEGINLREYVNQYGTMDVTQVLEVMRPILFSLGKIHHLGLIHRDISPENIVICQDGSAYLVDFGITRPYTGDDFKTMTVFFKRGYAAEEQYRKKGVQGPWTDIYAVCATMYYMLTGVSPVESAQRIIKDTLVPLAAYSKLSIPGNVSKAVKKGMSVVASGRYMSVEQLCRDLYGEGKTKKTLHRAKGKKAVMFFAAVLGGTVLGILVFLGVGAMSVGKNFSEGAQGKVQMAASSPAAAVWTPQAVSTTNPPSAGDALSKDSEQGEVDTNQAPSDTKFFKIPNVKGKTEKKAKKMLKNIGDPTIKITIKRVFHSRVAKGRVVRQSIQAGSRYRQGDIKKIVLTVSKGKKVATPTPVKTTPVPVQTARPKTTPAPNQSTVKKDRDNDFAGDLPY